MLKIILLLLAAFIVAPAAAQEMLEGAPPAIQQATIGSPSRVKIIEDQEIAAFRFVIDGREIARLDATGLHVRESIELGGTLTDTGTAYFDDYIEQEGGSE